MTLKNCPHGHGDGSPLRSLPYLNHINNLHQNINFNMEEESNRELAFLDTSLKRNNREISLLVYRKPTHTEHKLLCKANDQVATED